MAILTTTSLTIIFIVINTTLPLSTAFVPSPRAVRLASPSIINTVYHPTFQSQRRAIPRWIDESDDDKKDGYARVRRYSRDDGEFTDAEAEAVVERPRYDESESYGDEFVFVPNDDAKSYGWGDGEIMGDGIAFS
mmetsp:Transcript_3891/g.5025  ORF Transcript_3891/g.5025 Transcript_3891/m.5025 type:complete len:135 (-) Transcript_3891:924-1328(-)|eukprot:CAMPEP_0172520590 /NCGR_PEP_ID=MMETSP1066-20121228/292093_1 /TAXON_ID=671091 /ORGANISM="Coscinodiscus wailesii, Strain CCMP2513" /LENGTH=134 /DNA_ID=CAMNT_0013303379 /DNA_START=48 /DNA_END=455 /DNA_ORIENTATION=+